MRSPSPDHPPGDPPPTPLSAVLVDSQLNARLASDGFIVVPVLDATEVGEVLGRQAAMRSDRLQGLVIDFVQRDRSLMRETADLLRPVWGKHLPRLFVDHQPVISTFIVKHPGTRSRMLLHCEPTSVDGSARVYNLWIPLVDVDQRGGERPSALVPGTEHLPIGLMGFNTPVLHRPFEADLEALSIGIDVPAGYGVIYSSSMLHWSEDNFSDTPRPAITVAIAPSTAPKIHAVATGRSGRSIYAVDEEFFVDLHPDDVPTQITDRYPLLRTEFEDAQLTADTIATALGLERRPISRTVMPGKALSSDPLASPSPQLRVRCVPGLAPPATDLGVRASDLGDDAVKLVCSRGDASLAPLTTARRAIGSSVLSAIDALELQGHADVLVLDAHTEATLEIPRAATELIVIEAPRVNAGVAVSTGLATLEPTVGVDLTGCTTARFWNEGPGPLVALLISDPGRREQGPTSGPSPPRNIGQFIRRIVRAHRRSD